MPSYNQDERALQLWGGLECTVNRVGNRFLDQFAKSGHLGRPEDLDLVAGLGVRTLRYPVLWERTAPDGPADRDWRFADERLERIRTLGMEPIVGLVHHGSGPRYTSLVDESFAPGLAEHAGAVAERYPWIDAYTPVNEPLTTARFSGLYGHWYPHGTDGETYARALMNEIRATVLSMAAIRKVNPLARLVQTEDLGKTHATETLRYQAEFENERRWITWDLLCGRVDRDHPMWHALRTDGIAEAELTWLLDHPCPPDVIGINHYLTSERFLDHRLDRYPEHTRGRNALHEYADVEAVRVLAGGVEGAEGLLREAWERYALPLAVTECHLGCTREEQSRWLKGVWRQAQDARRDGIDVRAVTVWSMFGAHDWCSLLTREDNRYEPGVFDLRAPEPRPTLLAETVREIVAGKPIDDPGEGWWERPIRLLYPPVVADSLSRVSRCRIERKSGLRRPLLIVGAGDALGRTFAEHGELRGLDFVLLPRDDLDLAHPPSIRQAIDSYRPWGVIHAAGSPCPHDVSDDAVSRWHENAVGAGAMAVACAEAGAKLVVFSSDLVFQGAKAKPYVESDVPRPRSMLGRANVHFEREVLRELPQALVVRTSALFGRGIPDPFVARAARNLTAGRPFEASPDLILSPTYAPDLVDAVLDLLLDGMEGIVHLTNVGTFSPAEIARQIARLLGRDQGLICETPHVPPAWAATRSDHSVLASERAWVMPPLEDSLRGYLAAVANESNSDLTPGFLA